MMMFYAVLLVLLVLVLAVLVWPLLRPRAQQVPNEHKLLNREVLRRQLAELDRDQRDEALEPAAYAQAREELLQHQQDNETLPDTVFLEARPARVAAAGLSVTLLLLAGIGYRVLGNPAGNLAENRHPEQVMAQRLDKMVTELAAKLQQNPDNPKGWAMLALGYKAMGRLPEAKQAFERIPQFIHTDPDLLAHHADLLATLNNGNLEGQPLAELKEALTLDPNHPMALTLAGMAAYNRRDAAEAHRYFEHLATLLPPDSPDLAEINGMLVQLDGKPLPSAAPAPASELTGRVALAPALAARVQAGDVLFVYAQAVSGPPMPLAISRVPASSLPYNFRLDDSMAMSPQLRLSMFREVKIKARISHSGQAMPTAGDLMGESAVVAPGTHDLVITIDQEVK